MKEKELREKLNELVIRRCHPECHTYEEALEKELGFGCKIKFTIDDQYYVEVISDHEAPFFADGTDYDWRDKRAYKVAREPGYYFMNKKDYVECSYRKMTHVYPICQIIGQPITIGRVMMAITTKNSKNVISLCTNGKNEAYIVTHEDVYQLTDVIDRLDDVLICFWKLTTDDGQEATDDDQTIETIKAFVRVLEEK